MALSLSAVTTTTSGSTTAVTANIPTGVVAGEMVIICIITSQGSSTITGLGTSGLVHAPGSPLLTSGANATVNVLYKIASGSESGTYSLTASAGLGFWAAGGCRVSGAAATPWDTNSGTGTALNGSASATSLTTSMTTQAANEMLFNAAVQFNGGTWTAPAGFTKDFTDTAAPGALYFAHLIQVAAGATGTLTTSQTGAASQMDDWLGAIVPAGGTVVGDYVPQYSPDLVLDLAALQQAVLSASASTVLNVSTTQADATADAPQPNIAITVTPAEGAATATAGDASTSITVTSAEAAATATAGDASISATVTPAEAAASATAGDASIDIKVNAVDAGANATAFDATVSTANSTNAPADVALATADAPQPSIDIQVNAAQADATAAGQSPSITSTTTPAEGAASADAPQPQAAITVNAVDAGSTASANNAQGGGGAQPNQGDASADVPQVVIALTVGAAVATTTAAAFDATVVTGAPGSVNPTTAFATASAFNAQVCIETSRPFTGITVYNTATTARPGSGTTTYNLATTTRPNTGVTEDPCCDC